MQFLSTLSLRRATNINGSVTTSDIISIHALLAESDKLNLVNQEEDTRISIHALLAESDIISMVLLLLPTYFYPRSPCGERRGPQGCYTLGGVISIHALLAESDPRGRFFYLIPSKDFYPRSPCGERLDDILAGVNELLISIHALLAESDNCRK